MPPRRWNVVRTKLRGRLLERWFLKILINMCVGTDERIGSDSSEPGTPERWTVEATKIAPQRYFPDRPFRAFDLCRSDVLSVLPGGLPLMMFWEGGWNYLELLRPNSNGRHICPVTMIH